MSRHRFGEDDVRRLLGVVRDCQLGTTFAERWGAVTEPLRRLIPFDRFNAATFAQSAIFPVQSQQPSRVLPRGDAYAGHDFAIDYDAGELYLAHYAEHDPTFTAVMRSGLEPMRLSRAIAPGLWGKDAFTGEFLPRHGGRYALGCAPVLTDRLGLTFALFRGQGSDFDRRETSFLRVLVPYLTEATRGAILSERLGSTIGTAEGSTQGLCVFAADGELEYADAAARSLLARLASERPPGDLLRGGLRLAVGRSVPELRFCAPLRGDGWLELAFARAEALAGRVMVVVRALDPGTQDRFDAAAAAAGLSSREREVAALATQGQANKEIARQLGLSHNTVKEYLSSAYRKTGADGRAALTAYLLG